MIQQSKSEYHRPLNFTNVLENNILPTIEEYKELKDLDMRMHTLKLAQEIAKQNSSLNRPDGKIMSLNR